MQPLQWGVLGAQNLLFHCHMCGPVAASPCVFELSVLLHEIMPPVLSLGCLDEPVAALEQSVLRLVSQSVSHQSVAYGSVRLCEA